MTLLRFLPRFREAYRALQTLEARERWSRAEIEAYQLERLNAVWRHAAAHVPYYRTLAARARLPDRFRSLAEFRAVIPVLPRSLVRSDRQAFLSDRACPGHWDFSSGSTGTPTQFYRSREAHREVLRCKYRFQAMWGVDIFDRMVFLWGHSASFERGLAGRLASWRQPLLDRLRNRLRLSAYHLGRGDLRRALSRIARFQPAAVYAYTSAAHVLAQEAEAAGFHCDSLRLFILSAEPVYPHVTRTVERAFGVPAAIEYGCVEFGMVAAEWPDRTLRVREDVVLAETLPRQDGTFDIVLTSLNNPSFPLLRYASGDSTDTALEIPDRGFAVLRNVVGRQNDLIRTRSGRYLHPIRLDELFSRDVKVRSWQVHQRAGGGVWVGLEARVPTSPPDTAALEGEVRELLEGYPVEVEVVDVLPRTEAGKHRWIRSDLTAIAIPAPTERQS
jgi:phenylacetate-CoA ligase